MDWARAIEEERAALTRIVALLNALAGLAERAAGSSPAMRGFVLWVLRRAEAVACDFVAGGPEAPIALMPRTRPADAMRLAASLRRLARQLGRQARRMFGICGEGCAKTEQPSGAMPAKNVAQILSMLTPFAGPIPAPDTS